MKCIVLLTLTLLSQTVLSFDDIKLTKREMNCLYLNAYFEGNNDSVIAQQGIIEVVLNRKNSSKNRHKDVCSVIYKKHAFSWTSKKHTIHRSQQHVFKLTQMVVDTIVHGLKSGTLRPLTFGATFYHADYVKPCWLPDMSYVTKLGKHLFYKQVSNNSMTCIKRTRKDTLFAQYSPFKDPILVNVQRKTICQYCNLQHVTFVDPFDPSNYQNTIDIKYMVAMVDATTLML